MIKEGNRPKGSRANEPFYHYIISVARTPFLDLSRS